MSVGREQVRKLNITISSNAGTGTVSPIWAIARWIRVIPVAETDSFDVTFKDGEGDIMAKYTGQTGTFAANLELSLGILATVQIGNATQDGVYKVKFDLH